MALFGLFGKKSEESVLKKFADKAANKRVQAVDRWEAIQALSSFKTAESVEALLPRFGFQVDPSITDEEEKEAAFNGVVGSGEVAHAPVAAYLRKASAIAWPVKMLDNLITPEGVIGELVALLETMDVDYERDPSRKIDTLVILEERADSRIVPSAVRFLEDANETVRFSAVGAIDSQAEVEEAKDELVACLVGEESVRIRNRIFEAFATRGWSVGDNRDAARRKLTEGYKLDKSGKVSKR